jgi:hypothetical protein
MGRGKGIPDVVEFDISDIVRTLPESEEDIRRDEVREIHIALKHLFEEMMETQKPLSETSLDTSQLKSLFRRAFAMPEVDEEDIGMILVASLTKSRVKNERDILPSFYPLFLASGAEEGLSPHLAYIPETKYQEWVPRRGSNGINGGGGHNETKTRSASIHLKINPDDTTALCGKDLSKATSPFLRGSFHRHFHCGICKRHSEKEEYKDSSLLKAANEEGAFKEIGDDDFFKFSEKVYDQIFKAFKLSVATSAKVEEWERVIHTEEIKLIAGEAIRSFYSLDEETRFDRLFSLPPALGTSIIASACDSHQQYTKTVSDLADKVKGDWAWPTQSEALDVLIDSAIVNDRFAGVQICRFRLLNRLAKIASPKGYKEYLKKSEPSFLDHFQ